MILPPEVRHRDSRHLGRTIFLFKEVSSTNDIAASHTAEHEGTVFVARHQTVGRGQYGRVWQALPGSSLLLSVLLFPPPELRRPVILTAWAAVGIGDAIRELIGDSTRIKWPNDLFLGSKKVCGILIEQAAGVVVGLGLNLNQTVVDFADLPEATSLALASGYGVEHEAALEAVVKHLDLGYDRLISGDRLTLESEWKRRFALLGRPVRIVETDGRTQLGRLRDMSFDGIELDTAEGSTTVIRPESIKALQAISV